jgi:hypothetical protein
MESCGTVARELYLVQETLHLPVEIGWAARFQVRAGRKIVFQEVEVIHLSVLRYYVFLPVSSAEQPIPRCSECCIVQQAMSGLAWDVDKHKAIAQESVPGQGLGAQPRNTARVKAGAGCVFLWKGG